MYIHIYFVHIPILTYVYQLAPAVGVNIKTRSKILPSQKGDLKCQKKLYNNGNFSATYLLSFFLINYYWFLHLFTCYLIFIRQFHFNHNNLLILRNIVKQTTKERNKLPSKRISFGIGISKG